MSAKYSCFVSHAHGDKRLLAAFKQQFQRALEAELEAFFSHKDLWIDSAQIGVGDCIETALLDAICSSVCMLVIFVPIYAQSEWCLRELATAQKVESIRLQRLKNCLPADKGLILPVVLRGDEQDIPECFKSRKWADFTRYGLASRNLTRYGKLVTEIELIARYVHTVHREMLRLRNAGIDVVAESRLEQLEPAEPIIQVVSPRFPLRS